MANLHMVVFYICCAIAGVVFIALFYALFRFRRAKKHFGIELLWAMVPIVLLVFMAMPASKTFLLSHFEKSSAQRWVE